MRAGLPQKEPQLVQRWDQMKLYERLRASAAGRPKFVLHDGPPYANGNLHIGHALNKTLKDIIVRSRQMLGYDSAYVPGWDCHGLPIEWKVEEQYRAAGTRTRTRCRSTTSAPNAGPMPSIGWACSRPSSAGSASRAISRGPTRPWPIRPRRSSRPSVLKFAVTGQLYRGSKPVMWSVVEKTALAEAEIEYEDYQSDTIFVKFPVAAAQPPTRASARFETLEWDPRRRSRNSTKIWQTG